MMLYWALLLLVVVIVADPFSFGVIASASAAKILLHVFLALLVISLIMHFVRGSEPPRAIHRRLRADSSRSPAPQTLAARSAVLEGARELPSRLARSRTRSGLGSTMPNDTPLA
jgi:uncharacterized membrane protein YtjA (UPF0391 family)